MTKPTYSVWLASPDGWTETRRYVVQEDAWASVELAREPFTVVLPSNETPDPADLPAPLRFIPALPTPEPSVLDGTGRVLAEAFIAAREVSDDAESAAGWQLAEWVINNCTAPAETPAAETATTDQDVVDSIATMLGTNPRWSGADDLEAIANLIGKVRPHPGDNRPADYRAKFHAATGRPVNVAYDMADDEDEG